MLWYFDRASHFLANVASSVAWLLATGIVWVRSDVLLNESLSLICIGQGVASGVMHVTRIGGNCAGHPIISRYDFICDFI